MVIDNGFDTTASALKSNVAAQYTVTCDATPGGPDLDPGGVGAGDGGTSDGGAGPSFDELKAALIAQLGAGDESCHLREGIDPKAPFGTAHASQRKAWNAALLADTLPTTGFEGIPEEFDAEMRSMPFHGTATAGTMAFNLPWLRMVLVELPLATADERAAMFTCPSQADVDLVVSLLSDPDVRAAFLAQPQASVDRELADLRASRGVSLVNESFGSLTRYGFEQLELAVGCRWVDITAYFHVLDELALTYDQAHAEAGVLFVRSAGNDGAALNGPDDGPQCHPGDQHQVLVGAYGTDGIRSSFTDFGDCVDAYAPGEAIVVPLPGDWLTLAAGTSFSAPLVARLLAIEAPAPFAPETARAYLADLRLANRNIAVAKFPPEVIFDVSVAATKRALTASSPPAGGAAARGEWSRSSMTTGPSAPALRRALWPLRWATRQSRHR